MKKVFAIILAIMVVMTAAIPASAASDSFVPSIEQKDGPKIISQTDSKGNEVYAIIYDKDGHEIIGVPEDSIIITPISGAANSEKIIKDALEYAYQQIKDADNIGDLTSEVNDYIKKNYPEMSLNDLLVSQLFDIRLTDEYSKHLTDGSYFRIKLDFGESFLFYLMSYDKTWSIAKDYKMEGGVVTLDLSGATQIALVKSNYTPAVSDKNNAQTTSPQTGNYTTVLWIALGVLFACAATVLVVMYVKKRTKNVK